MTEEDRSGVVAGSWLVGRTRTAADRVGRAASSSTLARAARRLDRRLGALLGGSWLVAWLTAEPEPEVIVVDLRETWTVGPVLAAVDALAARVPPGAGEAVVRPVRRAAAPVRVVGLAILAVGVALVATGVVAAGAVVVLAGTLALFETRSWEGLRETVTGRLLRAVFAPPDETTPP